MLLAESCVRFNSAVIVGMSYVRVIERALEAMRELNGRNEARGASAASSVLSGWDKPKKKKEKRPAAVAARPQGSPTNKPPKRSRLPAAAVKEMRLVFSHTTAVALR